jgi:hypothetical protein
VWTVQLLMDAQDFCMFAISEVSNIHTIWYCRRW